MHLRVAVPLFAALGLSSSLASSLGAQCPDGSAPPCGARASTVPAVDPNRIVILPFRVATTDTLLGEGFAELLAAEFTGDAGTPRAVDMATVLHAWRRAGGGLRTPLSRARAIQVARGLGAGLVSDGSIVGLGHQITVTTTVITVPSGKPRGSPTRVRVPADSVDVALRASANATLAAIGGRTRVADDVRFTNSPDAMRAYLLGMAEWRRGRLPAAADAFDRAIALDSLFAQAWFRRANAASWKVPGPPAFSYSERQWALRHRLSPDERLVLTAILGRDYPRRRSLEETQRDLEQAAQLLPDNPDAQYAAGDWWFHRGSIVDPVNALARARQYLGRAAAIDSQPPVLQHLLDLSVSSRDTPFVRRLLPAFSRSESPGHWLASYIAAVAVGDTSMLRRLGPNMPAWRFSERYVPGMLFGAHISAPAMDTLMTRMLRASPPVEQAALRAYFEDVLISRGRPDAARTYADTLRHRRMNRELLAMAVADSTGIEVSAVVARLEAFPPADSLYVSARCMLALWRVHQDRSAEVPEELRRQDALCFRMADALRAHADSGDALRAVAVMDSAVRRNVLNLRRYEPFLLARAWEKVGKPDRALSAIRIRAPGGPMIGVWTLPYEARLAEQLGDREGAMRALRLYVDVMADAEQPFAMRVDAARRELSRLERER